MSSSGRLREEDVESRYEAPPAVAFVIGLQVVLSFTNALAFSPTDAMPLSRRAKLLMLFESSLSAIVILLVTARAVNIFK